MQEMLSFMLNFHGIMPYLIVFGILLACGLGVPIPEDITLFVGGMLAYYQVVNVWIMILVCMGGVLIGDSIIFFLGAKYGRALTKKPFFHKFLSPDRLEIVKKKFHHSGNQVIFAARFMPGLRAPTFFSAGTLHLPFRVFFFYDGMAALISVPTIVWTVYHFGALAQQVIDIIRDVEHGIIAVVAVVITFFATKWYLKHRRQQRLVHVDLTKHPKHHLNKAKLKKRHRTYTKHHR